MKHLLPSPHPLFLALISLSPLFLGTPAVVTAQWEPDHRLTVNDSLSYTSSNNAWCVAAAPRGFVHVVWSDRRDGNWEVYYKRSSDFGVTWSQDVRLSQDTGVSWDPSLALSDSVIHVAWDDNRDGNWEIYYRRSSDSGLTWSSEARLTNNPSTSEHPSVSASGASVHMTWKDGAGIFYKRSTDSGLTWSPDTAIYGGWPFLPSIATAGPFVHIVMQDHDWSWEVHYLHSTDSGLHWSRDTCLSNSWRNARSPSVAASDSMVHVAWQDDRDSSDEVYYKRSTDAGATWSPDLRLSSTPALSQNPSLSASGSLVYITWNDERDGAAEIYCKRSLDFGSSWSSDTRLTYDPGSSLFSSISLRDTMAHMVWWDDRDGNSEIYYKRNPRAHWVGVEESLKEAPPRTAACRVAPDPFSSYARVLGREKQSFVLYDIQGRRVGAYLGDRIGEGLSPGVYFLKPLSSQQGALRIVKVR
jgi:hypothetical protein